MQWPRSKRLLNRNLRLKGRLTILREKRSEDARADYEWRRDPELAALDATTPLRLTFDEYVRYYHDELGYPSPWSVRLAIDTHQGRHIGNCMYYDFDEEKRQTELGIMVGDRRYWGRGYGSDATATLLRHIFTETVAERVYLHTLQDNVRAQGAFRKVGFSDLRAVHKDGRTFIQMEAWRDEWLANYAARFAPDAEAAAHAEAAADHAEGV